MKYLNKIVEVSWEDAAFIHDFNLAIAHDPEELLSQTKTYGKVIFEDKKLIVVVVNAVIPNPDIMIIPKGIITNIKVLEGGKKSEK